MAAINYAALRNVRGLGTGWSGPPAPAATGVIVSEKDLRALLTMPAIPHRLIDAATREF